MISSLRDGEIEAFVYLFCVPAAAFYTFSALWACVDASRGCGARRHQPRAPLPTARAYCDALAVSLVSWLCVGAPWTCLLIRVVMPSLGAPSVHAPWSPTALLYEAPVFLLAVEFAFYATHRLLHHPLLHARVHKLHHTHVAPFALAAVYAHPLEHLFSNVLPVSLGPLLARSHPKSAALWACAALFSTCGSHCGWAMPFVTIPGGFHDHHHHEPSGNFGVLGLADRVFGTSGAWRRERSAAGRVKAT